MIQFSDHAIEQIKRRKITKSIIRKVLEKPDAIQTSFRNRSIYRKSLKDKTLEVIVVKEKTKIIVVTAYFIKEYEN